MDDYANAKKIEKISTFWLLIVPPDKEYSPFQRTTLWDFYTSFYAKGLSFPICLIFLNKFNKF